ncbi:hypothetical protein EVAR_55752_1 [Eumeta japonica]|uniref:Uncharacterized protein n=1 Tax=Eumeta variegata TaxID=151549 RepID=A0A4C1XCL6_EUMVA|nr:hypothetical protein EVAR_55752_1 [Eumeta japonica]
MPPPSLSFPHYHHKHHPIPIQEVRNRWVAGLSGTPSGLRVSMTDSEALESRRSSPPMDTCKLKSNHQCVAGL